MMPWQLVDCEATILREIENPRVKRRDVAQTYGLILCSEECLTVSWRTINTAIMARWSEAGLQWIKAQAQRVAKQAAGEAS